MWLKPRLYQIYFEKWSVAGDASQCRMHVEHALKSWVWSIRMSLGKKQKKERKGIGIVNICFLCTCSLYRKRRAYFLPQRAKFSAFKSGFKELKENKEKNRLTLPSIPLIFWRTAFSKLFNVVQQKPNQIYSISYFPFHNKWIYFNFLLNGQIT